MQNGAKRISPIVRIDSLSIWSGKKQQHTWWYILYCEIVRNGIKHQKQTLRSISHREGSVCVCPFVCTQRRRTKNGCALTWEEWRAISLSAWALWHRPCWKAGGVGGLCYRDNSSQVTLMENRKVLHSACEQAAAGSDRHTTTAHSS